MKTHLIDQLHSAIKGKRHIIWDWNGTLLDDVGHTVSVMNSLLAEHELPQLNRDRYRKIFDFPVLHYYQALRFNFEKESFESLCHKFVDRFMAGFRELPLIPEMKSVLMQLHREGLAHSVLSATDQPNLNSMVEHFELGGVFKFIFGIDNKFAGSKIDRGHELDIFESSKVINKAVWRSLDEIRHEGAKLYPLGIEKVLSS